MKTLQHLLLFILIFSGPTWADSGLLFGSFPIPGMVIDQDRGRFVLLAKEMAQRAGIQMEIKIHPTKRAMQHFVYGDTDVLFPVVAEKFPPTFRYARTKESIFTKRNYIFTLKGKKLLHQYSDLQGLAVAVTRGFSYSKQLTAYSHSLGSQQVRLYTVNSDMIAARMLLAGRIDAFLAEEISGKKAFQNLDALERIQFDQSSPVGVQDVFFAVNIASGGSALAAQLSKALEQMKLDGTFSNIMSK